MSTTRTNNAESGLATGTAASTANTGSPAGDAFSVVTAGTGGAITFDNAVTLHGSLNYLISQGSTGCFVEWGATQLPALAESEHRAVVRFTGIPTGEVPLFQGIGADLATQGWRLALLSTGKLRVRGTGSPGTSLQDSTTVLAINTPYRIAWKVVYGASGSIQVWIYANLESTVPTETIGPITTNTGTDLSRLRVGNTSSSPVLPAWRLDDLVVQDTGVMPGPVLVFAAPTANFGYTTSSLTATFTDSSTAAGGGPTITSWAWQFGDGATSASQNPSHVYAAAGSYNVTLTVTDSLGRTGTVTKAVSLTPPAATVKWVSLDNQTGWTVVGGGSDPLAATTDGVASTFVVSLIGPTDQPFGGTEAPITAPAAGTPLIATLQCDKIGAASGSFYGKLYRGATLLSTSAAVNVPDAHTSGGQPVTSLDQTIQLVFPAADVATVTNGDVLRLELFGNAS
jgi:PKD repeat protein